MMSVPSLLDGKTLSWMLHFGSWTLSVTVSNKDKEISDVKNVNSLYLLSFLQTRKLAISFEIGFIFPLNFHLANEKTY